MKLILYFLIIFLAFLFMEFVAWFSHKYIMHGFMWKLHKDHHQKIIRWLPFELNDIFVVIFAVPSWLFIMYGVIDHFDYKFAIGIGILFYGIAYFFVHEIIVHNRFKWNFKSENKYMRAVRRAHKVHHSFLLKKPSDNFGFVFLIPPKYFKDSFKEE